MSAHLMLDGQWQDCTDESCQLKFHLSDVTADEARIMPHEALQMILEILDPPAAVQPSGQKVWFDGQSRRHRDYDLPAVITPDRVKVWYQHGIAKRDGGKPTMIITRPDNVAVAYWHDPQGAVVHEVENWVQR